MCNYEIYIFVEADFIKESSESNLLATICKYPDSSTPGVFPHLTEFLDNFEVTRRISYNNY